MYFVFTTAEIQIFSFSVCKPSFLVPVTELGRSTCISRARYSPVWVCALKKLKQSKIANNLNLAKHISSREEINVKSWWNLVRSLTYKVLCVVDSEWRPRTWLRVVIRVSLAVRSSFGNGSKWLIFIHCRAVWLKRCSVTEKIHKARIALD